MSSIHCVVVWEFQCGGQWVPHTPGVTRTLERAHAKKLTRVVLSDADPDLKGHHVNLRTLTQCRDMPDGGTTECYVRRSCYSVQSVGGRGARWEWARLSSPPLPAELHYEPMPMEAQCIVEEAWCGGVEVVGWGGWQLAAGGGLARRGACVRLLRRAPQPPYPRARTAPHAPQPTQPTHTPHDTHTVPARRPRIPQQHTGSSVHSVQSTLSAHSAQSVHSAQSAHSAHSGRENRDTCHGQGRGGARSASPRDRDRKPNLARQILHNLNIFSNKQPAPPPDPRLVSAAPVSEGGAEPRTDTSCSSTRSTRRHSVDTISTYLSHESKDSLQQGSVGELLNCSGGSDDVFDSPSTPAVVHNGDDEVIDLRSLGVGVGACSWVRSVSCPQWGAVCPVCMQALCPGGGGGGGGTGGGGGGARSVALAACQHLLHLHCLADQLRAAVTRADHNEESIYIECLVCGRAYSAPPPPSPPAPPPPPPPPAEGAVGAQPPGSMAWRLQHADLPQCSADTAILVTYNFQSGVQGSGHPSPGAQYYAVGFPRHSVLPDTELGREVLSLLRVCWSRGVLFTVRASRTTGREHVVAWSARLHPPPPAAHQHYLPPARPHHILHHLRAQLHDLLHQT